MERSTCEERADEIVDYFYSKCASDRLTEAARNHLRKVAEFAICYAQDCGHPNDPDWWEREGRIYWKRHVDDLLSQQLLCRTDCTIDCKTLQAGINRQAGFVTRAMVRMLRRERRNRLLPSTQGGRDEDDILKILGMCPWAAGRT